jgi:hypothetical protein
MYTRENLKDRRFRLNNFYKIVDKQGNKVTFTENPIQRVINDDPALRKYILKSRQKGVTTNCLIEHFDGTIWKPNTNTCILSHDQGSLEKIFNIIKRAHMYMHPSIQPRLDRGGGSKYEMRFPEVNSKIYADLESRGDTINRLHISEAAFADPKRIRATLEAVPIKTGRVTFETTPNGMGNDFYFRWIDKNSYYSKLFFPWYYDDEYQMPVDNILGYTDEETEFIKKAKKLYGISISPEQIAFRRFKISDLKELYYQEYPEDDATCFLASGGAAMDQFFIKKLMDDLITPYKDLGQLKIIKPYDKTHYYAMGADVAEGVSSDYSVCVVIDITTREVVCIFRANNIRPWAFAHQIDKVAKMYQHGAKPFPKLGVEINNHGHAVVQELWQNIGYRNLYFHKEDSPGWKTDMITRPLMVDAFIEIVENGGLAVNCSEILAECLTLVDNDGKIEAADGSHDDTIIATAIAIQMMVKSGNNDLYENLHKYIKM